MQHNEMLTALPAGLFKTLARSACVLYQTAHTLDVVEAWLMHHLTGPTPAKYENYPPWAMLTGPGASAPAPYTRWWGTPGNLTLDRDGVVFTPADALEVSEADLLAFWDVVMPLLIDAGWALDFSTAMPRGGHQLLSSSKPVVMEQASPWSVQGVRLTDCLPRSQACSDWRGLWHAIQMALHGAKFNEARQARGLQPLNALWFWGGGQVWKIEEPWPRVQLVDNTGLKPLALDAVYSNATTVRFQFWQNLLAHFFEPGTTEFVQKPAVVYCVEFEGWGTATEVFGVLQSQLVQPMHRVGLHLEWVLGGEQGWRSARTRWYQYLCFWRRKPSWDCLSEPTDPLVPTEESLEKAWQAGLKDQDRLHNTWNET